MECEPISGEIVHIIEGEGIAPYSLCFALYCEAGSHRIF